MNCNIAVIFGNIVREPEYRTTNEGTAVCSFTVAVQRNYKDSTGDYPADFIPCVAWRNTAEIVHKYCLKGSPILVIGEVQTRSYTDKNGNKRHPVEIIANRVSFMGKKEKTADTSEINIEKLFGDELEEYKPIDDSELPF